MADPTEAVETDTEGQAPKKKDWRKELEERAEKAESGLVDAARELALYKSGLVELTEDQRDDVLTLAKAKGDTSPEALRAIADRLSYTSPAATAPPVPQGEVAAEAAQIAALAASPSPTNQPTDSTEETIKQIEDFEGDFQAYQQFILANADSILPPELR